MDLDEARAVIAEQHRAVLATLRRDGTPQMSPGLLQIEPTSARPDREG
jgi:hypothetical protein